MRILVCIPVMVNSVVFDECLKQIVGKPDVHVMILLNGANDDVKNHVKQYENGSVKGISIHVNPINEYVTKAWNTFLHFFLHTGFEFDKLIILNSDLTLGNGWENIVRYYGDLVIVPTVTDNKLLIEKEKTQPLATSPAPHPPGIFISLSKEQAKLVYPIPEQIKIWFNDTWIFKILNATGHQAIVVNNLLAFHHHSTTVSAPWANTIIQQDKKVWPEVEKLLEERIKQLCK